ncbi:MAG TPA: FG-GAP-like repeat-containing protein [Terriglobales bacterium]|nr:FG-GAP-like repeat-containing protein [Terriglobales bacterium]
MIYRRRVELAFPGGLSKSSSRDPFHLLTILFVNAAAIIVACASAFGETATTTALAVTADGNPVTSISAGSMITLTASVKAGSTAVTRGQVNFCDADFMHCTDIHLLGSAQLNSAGQAQMHLRPGPGNYSYKAIFLGTPTTAVPYAASASGSSALVVNGQIPTSTILTQSGPSGNYTLTATVLGFTKSQALPSPVGTVSFIDQTTGNSLMGTADLSPVDGPTWINVSNPAAGSSAANILALDFNGDGNIDLAVGINSVAGGEPASAAILLGDGQGNFTPVAGSPTVPGGLPVAAADFNQDGIPDLLLSDPFNRYLTVLLGRGDGTFNQAPGTPLISSYGVAPIAMGDFNGDGILDLAAAGAYYMIMWIGNGDGSFTAMPTTGSYYPADSFYSMVVGDFNGDGNADIAAAYLGNAPITILLGNGDGTFTKGPQISANAAYSLALGDFDGDGKLDLAAPEAGDAVDIFLGNGDGTFHPASGSPIPAGQYPHRVTIADFNGDGIADLIVTNQTSLTDVFVLLGNGDGTFVMASTGTMRLPCCSNTVVADFNGDGASDFASSDFYNGTADIYLTGAKQSSTEITGISISGQTPQYVVANYPGDSSYSSSQANRTALLVQAAAPTFAPAPGGIIAVTQTIALTSSTPSVGIYYQVSGALETDGWVQYFAPIPIYNTGNVTIQAYAASLDYGASPISTATYTVIAVDPVPVLNSVSPPFVTAGSHDLTLTIDGSAFTSTSTAYLGTLPLTTQFVTTTEVTAQITSTQMAAGGVKALTVQNPIPGGGTSNILQFEIDSGGGTPPSFTTTSATVTAGSSATYPVTLPANATNISVNCLNLPTGASCAYSAGALSISTSTSTLPGTYQITVVFAETLPGVFSLAFAALLFLPLGSALRKGRARRDWLWFATLGPLVLLLLSCGGGGNTSPPPPQTHHVTTSGVVTLTVQ